MDLYTVTIDNQEIRVAPHTTVLEAARQLGIEIPTLCFHESLQPEGSCRICIVEMSITKRGKEYRWIDAACVYPVEEGLQVYTDTERVIKERKVILELLLSRAPQAPVLNQLAAQYGILDSRFEAVDKGKANCILCGLCVRVCNQLLHTGGIGTAFRGIHKKIVSPLKIASSVCTGCTACSLVCPTGAVKVIEDEEHITIPAWEADVPMMECVSCGKAFAPVNLVNEVIAKVPVKAETLKSCPECRRKAFRAALKI